MHSLSIASGIAIGRLVKTKNSDENSKVVMEAAEFTDRARLKLGLENSSIVTAIMFAQSLISLWLPHWKFAYTIGLSLAIKFTTDGFYLIDIIEHLTDEFSLNNLQEGERIALSIIETFDMERRFCIFRCALANLALNNSRSSGLPVFPADERFQDCESPFHVLLIDESAVVRRQHRLMVLAIRPGATVGECARQAP